MKRTDLLIYLGKHGCEAMPIKTHQEWWHDPKTNRKSTIPTVAEINNVLAAKICKDLGIPPVK